MPINKCIICAVHFNSWQEYNEHMLKHKNAASPLAPLKTSNRTHEQIVAHMEADWIYPYLIGYGVDAIKPIKRVVAVAEKIEIVRGFEEFAQEVSK